MKKDRDRYHGRVQQLRDKGYLSRRFGAPVDFFEESGRTLPLNKKSYRRDSIFRNNSLLINNFYLELTQCNAQTDCVKPKDKRKSKHQAVSDFGAFETEAC